MTKLHPLNKQEEKLPREVIVFLKSIFLQAVYGVSLSGTKGDKKIRETFRSKCR